MRKFKLLLPGDRSVTFTNKLWTELRQGDPIGWMALLSFLGFSLLAGFVLVLPFIFLSQSTVETSFAYYLLFTVGGLLALTVGLVLLGGWKVLTDTKGLVAILLFALLSILAFLFAPATTGNTLGASTVKYLGAIFLMVMIGLFYLTVVFTNTLNRFALLLNVFLISLGLMFLARWLYGISGIIVEQSTILDAFQGLLISTTLVWLVGALWGTKVWRLISCGLLIIGLLVSFTSKTQITVTAWSQIVVLLVGLVMLVLSLKNQKWQLRKIVKDFGQNVRNLINSKDSVASFVAKSQTVLLTVSVLVWLVLMVVWFINNHLNLQLVTDLVAEYRNAFASWTDLSKLLIGRGATGAAQTSALATVIVFQGLLGLVAYLVLIISSLGLAIRTWANTANWIIKAAAAWLIGASLLFVTTRVHIATMILWWMSLAIMATSYVKLSSKTSWVALKNFRFSKFLSPLTNKRLQIILAVAIIVLWAVATRWLWMQAQVGKI